MLFGTRLGFSGTPSSLLPTDFGQCQFERGTEGKVVQLLTSPTTCSSRVLEDWSVKGLLREIAQAQNPPFHALIDVGALITGMSNQDVASFLLQVRATGAQKCLCVACMPCQVWLRGRVVGVWGCVCIMASDCRSVEQEGLHDIDACVFINTTTDEKLAMVRGRDKPIPLVKCGVSPLRQFTFFDQVHTTGHDIKQSLQARAAVTIGKDTTLRDYAQGCWRMRQLEEGQTLEVFVVEQVMALVHESTPPATIEAGGEQAMLNAVMTFLLLNSCRSEQMQHAQLQMQNLSTVWRAQAVEVLRKSTTPGVHPSDDVEDIASVPMKGRLVTRFQESQPCCRALKQLVDRLDFDVPDKPRVPQPFSRDLQDMLDAHRRFLSGYPDAFSTASTFVARVVEAEKRRHQALHEAGDSCTCGGVLNVAPGCRMCVHRQLQCCAFRVTWCLA